VAIRVSQIRDCIRVRMATPRVITQGRFFCHVCFDEAWLIAFIDCVDISHELVGYMEEGAIVA
jgi:hypothetical protein